jgi:branched-chain amino acid transport system permease protein
MDWKRYRPVAVAAALVLLTPLLTSLFSANYYLTQLTMSAYYLLVALGLCLLMGYAGQISLGQAGFFAIGGYTSAALTTMNLMSYSSMPLFKTLLAAGILSMGQSPYGDAVLFLSPWIAFIAALLLTALVAFLLGLPVLKL